LRYNARWEEVMKMTVLKRLKEYLEKNQVSFEVGYHQRVYTAQEIAATEHVRGRELAKVVMVKADGKMVMLVLPASFRVDMEKLKGILKSKKVEKAKEEELQDLFADGEVRAMPPFDAPLSMWLTKFSGGRNRLQYGSHVETLKDQVQRLCPLVNPKVGQFSAHLNIKIKV
jgi:Ala-tRNA(Pro) deacylase